MTRTDRVAQLVSDTDTRLRVLRGALTYAGQQQATDIRRQIDRLLDVRHDLTRHSEPAC